MFRPHETRSDWCIRVAMSALFLVSAGCATTNKIPPVPKQQELVWPLPPEQPRVAFLKSVSSNRDAGDTKSDSGRLKDVLLGEQENLRRLVKPYGVHADDEGRIFVADTGPGRLVVFDFKKNKFSLCGEKGQGALSKPVGVTSDDQGRGYVTDEIQKRAVVYDREGKFLHAIDKMRRKLRYSKRSK